MAGEKSHIQSAEQERQYLIETVGPGTKKNYSLDLIAEMVTRWSMNRAFQGLSRTFVTTDIAAAGADPSFDTTRGNAYAANCWAKFKKFSGNKEAYDDEISGPSGSLARFSRGASTAMQAALKQIAEDAYVAALSVWSQHNATTVPILPGK